MNMKDLFILGGWAMWPLLVFSVAAVAIIIERSLYLLIHRLGVRDLADEILSALEKGKVDAARNTCSTQPRRKLAAQIFKTAFASIDLGEHRIERVMEAAAAKQVQSLEKGFDLLLAIGSIAPITGFLGTVSGMINAFRNIAQASDVNAQLVAGGIFEALITTAYGLTIAIAAIAAYNIFAHIVDRFTAAIEEAGNEIITALLRSSFGRTLPAGNDVHLGAGVNTPSETPV